MKTVNWVLGYGRIIWIVGALFLGFAFDFLVRFEEKFYHYSSIYKEKEAKYHDCSKYLPGFMNDCKDIAHFLDKGRFWRTLTDVMGQTNLCGRHTCIDYIFGPELSFTFFGQLIKFFSIGVAIWLFIIICKYISGALSRRTRISIHDVKPITGNYEHTPWVIYGGNSPAQEVQAYREFHKNQTDSRRHLQPLGTTATAMSIGME